MRGLPEPPGVAWHDPASGRDGGYNADSYDGGANADIRDVMVADHTADNGGQCSMNIGGTVGARVRVNGECWQHSHPDEGSVYDFSWWTLDHPGTREAVRYEAPFAPMLRDFAVKHGIRLS